MPDKNSNHRAVYESAKEAALRYLSYRMRTRGETEKYLIQKGYPDDIIQETIETLSEYRYIDDLKFAEAYIESCLKTNRWGMKKIKYTLTLKGVSPEIIEEASENAEYRSDGVITELIIKKTGGFGPAGLDAKEKRKLFSYLSGRGFSYGEIDGAYSAYLEAAQ